MRVISSLARWLFLESRTGARVRQSSQGQEQDVGKGELEVKIPATLIELDTAILVASPRFVEMPYFLLQANINRIFRISPSSR